MDPRELFTGREREYALARPSYPALLRIIDLGAGTGISSRLLAARGAHVVAVEPNADMCAHGHGSTPAPRIS